jgi:proteasome component ECM29
VESILQLIDVGLLSSDTTPGNVSAAHGLEASKLRSQIFSFVSWTARIGSAGDLQQIAPNAIPGLRNFIESQGWPNPASTGQKLSAMDLSLRSNAYETIGILAPKLEYLAQDENLDLLRWLFTSLSSDNSGDQIFISIEQALGSIINAYSGDSTEAVQENLRSFLVHHMTLIPGEESSITGYNVVRSTRFAAVRFANRCLPYSDVHARWIDLLAVGGGPGERHEIVEEGMKGLDPYWYRMMNPRKDGPWLPDISGNSDNYPRYMRPSVKDLVLFLFSETTQPMSSSGQTLAEKFSGPAGPAFVPAASFCRNILVWDALDSSESSLSPSASWDKEINAAICTNEKARATLKTYLKTSDEKVMLTVLEALLLGLLVSGESAKSRSGEQFLELCSLSPDDLVGHLCGRSQELLQTSLASNNRQIRETASHAYGIIASHSSYEMSYLTKDIQDISSRTSSWKNAVGSGINSSQGAILSGAYVISRLASRKRLHLLPEGVEKAFIERITEVLLESRDLTLRNASHAAIGQLGIFSVFKVPYLDLTKQVIDKLVQDAKLEQERPIIALGQFATTFSSSEDGQFKNLLESLYKLHEVRRPEVQFAVGEALATAAARWSSKSLMTALDVDALTPDKSFNHDFFAEMLDKIIQDCRNSKPSLKKAAAIWLLCMTQYCGHLQEVQDRLRKFQATFGSLLSDRDEVVQETGSRGLSLVYEMGDKDLKDSLVRDLVKSFTSTNVSMGGTVSEDTELFDPGALPTGDGSVTTYKDIMNLASEVGDPSLVYRFMTLASNNAIWSSRAAFGRFGLSNVLSDSSSNGYLAENPKLYPVLFRYKHDPNPNVQRSMNEIWSALVKDSNAVIDQNFDAIMRDLVKSILGREWRVRQASCAAIADLVQGREIEQLEKYLHDIWNVSFKVLDDIKETVRVAALSLCQVLTNLLLRSLEVGDSSSKRSYTMLENVIPFLLSPAGLDSSAKEVQVYAVSTLLKVIKKAPSKSLKVFIPQLLERLIASLSSFEPEEVNYINLNADKYGTTGNEIDKIRLSGIRMSPLMEAIERCLDGLDEDSMKEAVLKLEESLRSAVGLPSKVGCSRVIVSLSTRQNVIFRPYADRILQLLRKLVLDRNDTVSASYSSAIGYLMRIATDKQVLQTIEFSKSLYFDSEGGIAHSMDHSPTDQLTHGRLKPSFHRWRDCLLNIEIVRWRFILQQRNRALTCM